MQLKTIKEALAKWRSARLSGKEATEILGQGVLFRVDVQKVIATVGPDPLPPPYIHAYPGVHKGKLVFFLINSLLDSSWVFEKEGGQKMAQHIITEEVMYMDEVLFSMFMHTEKGVYFGEKGNIGAKEAIKRITHWSLSKNKWINSKTNSSEGLFEAFTIPAKDLRQDVEVFALFGLKEANGNHIPVADLIFWDKEKFILSKAGPALEFEDVVRPVPPFGQGPTSEHDFYLLKV